MSIDTFLKIAGFFKGRETIFYASCRKVSFSFELMNFFVAP
jgi:hypothetical protein